MSQSQLKVIIVGGGTAGWLTAGVLASRFVSEGQGAVQVSLIESPDVKTIGVGEGTWPSMRSTLRDMGISETEFMRECDVSFKQGSRFNGWRQGGEPNDDNYYHPFSLPSNYSNINLASYWQASKHVSSFAHCVSPQSHVCDRNLAPKQITTPEFALNMNYGYHLDAGKFAQFLKTHCTETLGVKFLSDHVVSVENDQNAYIKLLKTRTLGDLTADLFIDCTGFASILLGQHYGIELQSKKDVLFNDSALAAQLPYLSEQDPVLSHTLSTAQTSGWIWDIGLPTRRGVGYVYSNNHSSHDEAEIALRSYIKASVGAKTEGQVECRKISITPGYRKKFWHKNCIAIGLSAGFVEPLEASALVLVELAAKMLAEHLPSNRETMNIVANRFNDKFTYHWERIIDFLKLHYVLSQRKDSSYWIDNASETSIPDSLKDSLTLWSSQTPWHWDAPHIDELFPSASFQYVLYGMGFEAQHNPYSDRKHAEKLETAIKLFAENEQHSQKLLSALPSNRDLLNKVRSFGFPKI